MIGAITAGLYGAPTPPVTNSYESIATTIVGAGGAADVTFNLTGVTGFKHLQIRGILPYAASANALCVFANGDTGSNYSWHQLYGAGSGAGGASGSTSTNIPNVSVVASSGSAPAVFITDILDYTNTSKNKTYRTLSGYDANGGGLVAMRSTLWMNTSAVTSLTVKFDAGSLAQYSSIALYGIRG